MKPLKVILVAVDFSTCSKAAMRQASRIAVKTGAALRILHVVDQQAVMELADARGVTYDQQAPRALEGAQRDLERWLQQEPETESAQPIVIVGTPLDAILQASSEDVDLVVLGAHGVGNSSAWAGSVATKVMRKCPVSVLLVTVEHSGSFKTVVAGIDFSDASSGVVATAREIAKCEEAALHFVHVWRAPWLVTNYMLPAAEVTADFQEKFMNSLRLAMTDLLGEPAAETNEQRILHHARNTGQGLAEYARHIHADLVVVGDKGRTNLSYVLLGSTTERLLRESNCAVLVTKQPDHHGDT